jgi:omega-6 fatty acid desaturase (delta-12 desaturase)
MTRHLRCSNVRSAIHMSCSCLTIFALCAMQLYFYQSHPLIAIALAVVAGVVSVRIFNLMHDCSHYSYFTSRRANEYAGVFLGVLALIPYHYWKYHHLRHHGTSCNLDRRGHGDIWMLTVDEYRSKARSLRTLYRLYRNPVVFLVLGPIFYFVLKMRLPTLAPPGTRERSNIWHVNLIWMGVYVAAGMAGYSVGFLIVLHFVCVWVGG